MNMNSEFVSWNFIIKSIRRNQIYAHRYIDPRLDISIFYTILWWPAKAVLIFELNTI